MKHSSPGFSARPVRAGFITVSKDRALEAVCFRTGMHALHLQSVELSRPSTYRYPMAFAMTPAVAQKISSEGCDQGIVSASLVFMNIVGSPMIFLTDAEFHDGFDLEQIDALFVLLEGVRCLTVRRRQRPRSSFVQGQVCRHEAGEQIFMLRPGATMRFIMDGHSHWSLVGFSEQKQLLFEGEHEFVP